MRGKVLILSNNLSGLYCFRKEVVLSIVDAGFETYLSIPDVDSNLVEYFKGIGCKIVGIAFNRRGMNPFADIKLMLSYRTLIQTLKPVAVLTYTIKPNIYGGMAARLCGVPQLANITGLGDAIENGGWMQKLTVALYKIGIGKAQRVFFQNNANRDFCLDLGIADEESILLPGSGVNLQYHTYQEYPEDGVTKFLFIARLLKDKGTNEFFEMAQVIKARYPQVEFQILGAIDGNCQHQLNELVSKEIVVYLGTTTDVRPYLSKIHCTVMPSYHEGMSNVNLESAANGRPVITTNVPGCRETVDDGKTGILVAPRNTQSLIDGVEKFMALSYEQKRQMGIEGRIKVEKEFDRQIVVKEYIKALTNV